MCRLPKKIQYVDKASSSADVDTWEYNKKPSINNNNNDNNKKGDYFHTTLLVNDVPIKFVKKHRITSYTNTPTPFNDISKVTRLNTVTKM